MSVDLVVFENIIFYLRQFKPCFLIILSTWLYNLYSLTVTSTEGVTATCAAAFELHT